MKAKKILLIFTTLAIAVLYTIKKEGQIINDLKRNHATLLDNHEYRKNMQLSRSERKEKGLAPNKYYEQEYLYEMDPETGKTYPEKLIALNAANELNRVPGSSTIPWEERGPDNVPGRTRAMLYDPNDATHKRVFAGGVTGGLWVNDNIEDVNSAWQQVNVAENMVVSSITVDAVDSNTIYIGTGEPYVGAEGTGNGIWKSTDGGDTWTHIFGGNTGGAYFINDAQVTVNSPGSIATDYIAINSRFTDNIIPIPSGGITGDFILANDPTDVATEGCNTFGPSASSKIAIIDRGTCNFTIKVKNAQLAGASAVIIIQSLPGFPFGMGGDDASITIPSVMVSKIDGDLIKNAMASGTVNGTILPVATTLPAGVTLVPGKYYVNDIISRNNGGTSEIYAAITDSFGGGAVLGAAGLYKSVDGGVNWTLLTLPNTTGGNPTSINDLYLAPNNSLYAGSINSTSYSDGGGRIFVSTDGVNFTTKYTVADANRVEIAGSSTNSSKIYALIVTTTGTKLYKTTAAFAFPPAEINKPNDPAFNAGPDAQGWYDLAIAVDPSNDNKIYIGGNYVHKTINSGSTWSQVTHYYSAGSPGSRVHVDIHNILMHPTNPNKGLIANDGGVYYVNDWANAQSNSSAMVSMNKNYNTTQFYRGAIGQDASNVKILGGAQDNGTNLINNATAGINSSTSVSGGDGMLCFIDKDSQYMISSLYYNYYLLTDMNGGILSTIVNEQTEGNFVNAAELDDNLDILYSDAGVWDGSAWTDLKISRHTNLTGTPVRTDLSDAMMTRPASYMKVSPYTTASTTLFIGTSSGDLFKITNADTTPTWTDLTPPAYSVPFTGSISSIDFGVNEDEIMVTFHNYNVTNIYFTTDGGTTWTSKEGNLPDLPVKDILMNPLNNNEVIIATDLGVWTSENFRDANPTWTQSYNGMKNVKVTSFDLRTSDNTVLAATYGRGMFTGTFTADTAAINEFSQNTNTVQVYPTVSNGSFTVKSNSYHDNATMQIFDMNGKSVFKQNIDLNNEVNTSVNLKSGTYIVNLIGENLKESHKIIIK